MPLIQEKLSLWDGPQGRHQPHTVPSSFLERNISHLFLSAGKGGAALGYPTFHQRSALSWQSPELVTTDFEGLINMNFIRKERHGYSRATTLLTCLKLSYFLSGILFSPTKLLTCQGITGYHLLWEALLSQLAALSIPSSIFLKHQALAN